MGVVKQTSAHDYKILLSGILFDGIHWSKQILPTLLFKVKNQHVTPLMQHLPINNLTREFYCSFHYLSIFELCSILEL
jgi:hypothetical protein